MGNRRCQGCACTLHFIMYFLFWWATKLKARSFFTWNCLWCKMRIFHSNGSTHTTKRVENKQYNATTCIQFHMFHYDKCLSHNCTGKILLSLTVLSSSSPLDVQGRSINKHQKFILGHLQPRTMSNLVAWWLHQYTSFDRDGQDLELMVNHLDLFMLWLLNLLAMNLLVRGMYRDPIFHLISSFRFEPGFNH
jgi:hypothetical protein